MSYEEEIKPDKYGIYLVCHMQVHLDMIDEDSLVQNYTKNFDRIRELLNKIKEKYIDPKKKQEDSPKNQEDPKTNQNDDGNGQEDTEKKHEDPKKNQNEDGNEQEGPKINKGEVEENPEINEKMNTLFNELLENSKSETIKSLSINDYKALIKEIFDKLKRLQNLLTDVYEKSSLEEDLIKYENLTDEYTFFDSVLIAFTESGYFEDKNLNSFIRQVYRYAGIRPKKSKLYILLLNSIINRLNLIIDPKIDGMKSKINAALKSYLYFGFQVNAFRLIKKLIKEGFISWNEYIMTENRFLSNHLYPRTFVKESTLSRAIRKDDIVTMQKIINEKNLNFNFRIKEPQNMSNELLSVNPTLIKYAAYYGSEICFEYLNKLETKSNNDKAQENPKQEIFKKISTQSKDTYTLLSYKTAGGTNEMGEGYQKDTFTIPEAKFIIMYHRRNFMEKIPLNGDSNDNQKFLYWCIKYEFYYGIYFLYNNRTNMKQIKVNNPIAFEIACESNATELAVFLASREMKDNVKEPNFDMYVGLSKAAWNGCINLLKALQEKFKDKFNIVAEKKENINGGLEMKKILEKGYYLPLFEACRGLQFETMKWLLQLDGLKLSEELNSTILESFTFLDACKTSDSKTLSLFLKLHNYENAISPYVAVFF